MAGPGLSGGRSVDSSSHARLKALVTILSPGCGPMGCEEAVTNGPPALSSPRNAADHRYKNTVRDLRAPCAASVRDGRHRIPAREHLLPQALRAADGERRRIGRGRRAGARNRASPAVRPAGRPARGQGVPRRPPGHRDLLARGADDPCPAVRHPGRGHGARLWRFHLLRPARAPHHRRHPRQVEPLHRLDAPAAQRRAADLCGVGRHPPARRVHEAVRRSRTSAAAPTGCTTRCAC